MEGLLGFTRDWGYREMERGYISKCDLCLDIRKYLVNRAEFDELRPKGFYDRVG
jgi:hypothetical protein